MTCVTGMIYEEVEGFRNKTIWQKGEMQDL